MICLNAELCRSPCHDYQRCYLYLFDVALGETRRWLLYIFLAHCQGRFSVRTASISCCSSWWVSCPWSLLQFQAQAFICICSPKAMADMCFASLRKGRGPNDEWSLVVGIKNSRAIVDSSDQAAGGSCPLDIVMIGCLHDLCINSERGKRWLVVVWHCLLLAHLTQSRLLPQIRALSENAGLGVLSLKRVRIGAFKLPKDLGLGEFRELKPSNIKKVTDRGAALNPQLSSDARRQWGPASLWVRHARMVHHNTAVDANSSFNVHLSLKVAL